MPTTKKDAPTPAESENAHEGEPDTSSTTKELKVSAARRIPIGESAKSPKQQIKVEGTLSVPASLPSPMTKEVGDFLLALVHADMASRVVFASEKEGAKFYASIEDATKDLSPTLALAEGWELADFGNLESYVAKLEALSGRVSDASRAKALVALISDYAEEIKALEGNAPKEEKAKLAMLRSLMVDSGLAGVATIRAKLASPLYEGQTASQLAGLTAYLASFEDKGRGLWEELVPELTAFATTEERDGVKVSRNLLSPLASALASAIDAHFSTATVEATGDDF